MAELSKYLNMQDGSDKLTVNDPFKVMWRWTSSLTQGLSTQCLHHAIVEQSMKRSGKWNLAPIMTLDSESVTSNSCSPII